MKAFPVTKAFVKSFWIVLIIGMLILPIVSSACAQTPPPEKRFGEIEEKIQALEQAADELLRDLQSAETQKPKSDAHDAPDEKSSKDDTRPSSKELSGDVIRRIRNEGFNRSQVMQTLSYLTNVIGPRLTGSPNLKRANQWTSDRLASWGLTNAHLESWGPSGRGWSLKRFSVEIVEPQAIPLIGCPREWSPGLERPITAEVIYLNAKSEADLKKYKGKLKGAVVLFGSQHEVKARFEPPATRLSDADLIRLANAGERQPMDDRRRQSPPPSLPMRIFSFLAAPFAEATGFHGHGLPTDRMISFLNAEGAALVVTPSYSADGGRVRAGPVWLSDSDDRRNQSGPNAPRRRAWSVDAPAIPAQIVLATEHYNRLVRMIEQGEKLKMAVDLQVQFHNDDLMAYNTIAEIPGGDLKDEIVMLGAHLDSLHVGSGAIDDATGVAAAMEAVRIIKALKLQPRRTIRIALWSGEEQGLFGSEAYVAKHFGKYNEDRKLVRQPDYEKFSVYFNLDEGTGKIRGIYLQGNEAVRPIFRRWLEPFRDLGAETISLANSRGASDHDSFDYIGLPGFHFIQDPIDFWSAIHSNSDVFDRAQADDLKQASVILAALTYNAAMTDGKLPRKTAK
jgi:carboxypeptidase Q